MECEKMENKEKYEIVEKLFGEDVGDLLYCVNEKDWKGAKDIISFFESREKGMDPDILWVSINEMIIELIEFNNKENNLNWSLDKKKEILGKIIDDIDKRINEA